MLNIGQQFQDGFHNTIEILVYILRPPPHDILSRLVEMDGSVVDERAVVEAAETWRKEHIAKQFIQTGSGEKTSLKVTFPYHISCLKTVIYGLCNSW